MKIILFIIVLFSLIYLLNSIRHKKLKQFNNIFNKVSNNNAYNNNVYKNNDYNSNSNDIYNYNNNFINNNSNNQLLNNYNNDYVLNSSRNGYANYNKNNYYNQSNYNQYSFNEELNLNDALSFVKRISILLLNHSNKKYYDTTKQYETDNEWNLKIQTCLDIFYNQSNNRNNVNSFYIDFKNNEMKINTDRNYIYKLYNMHIINNLKDITIRINGVNQYCSDIFKLEYNSNNYSNNKRIYNTYKLFFKRPIPTQAALPFITSSFSTHRDKLQPNSFTILNKS